MHRCIMTIVVIPLVVMLTLLDACAQPTLLDTDFNATNVEVEAGESVEFADATTGGVSPYAYEWDFDNNGIADSAEKNPSYTYSTAGTYTVSLKVIDTKGDTNAETKEEYITVTRATVSLEEMAVAFVDFLKRGQYDEAAEMFDESMSELTPAPILEETWNAVIAQVGEFEGIVGTRTAKYDIYDLVFVTCSFANATLDVQLSYDDERQVAGLFFVPPSEAGAYSPPQYANADSFTETDLVVGTGEWRLPATLTMPKGEGPFPAVILVHGSGPNDRDETVGANRPFKDLAWGLATSGIAVLRYEKRTKEYPAELAAMIGTLTVREETIDDALAAIDLLREVEGVDAERIFILGHSLGGMLAPRIAAQSVGLAGVIILAGPTRSLEDLILEQTIYLASLDGEIDAYEATQIEQIRNLVNKVKELDMGQDEVVLGAARAYWQDLVGYDPTVIAQGLTMPMLILQGERDYQVTMQDFEGWASSLQGQDNATLKSYADLNHLFISGTGQSIPDEYSEHGNVAQIVIEDIVAWVASQD